MATKRGKTVKVTLEYGYAVTSPRFKDVKKGDRISFTCPQGDLNLVLTPKELFEKTSFKSGDEPILVKKDGAAKIWCGGTFRLANGHGTVGSDGDYPITIKPKRGKYGVHSED